MDLLEATRTWQGGGGADVAKTKRRPLNVAQLPGYESQHLLADDE